MKTPLPKKMGINPEARMIPYEIRAINQLIDYLKEREDGPSTETGGRGGTGYQIAAESQTPTLKEMLLGEIKETARPFWGIPAIAVEDVEAIVNRLIP